MVPDCPKAICADRRVVKADRGTNNYIHVANRVVAPRISTKSIARRYRPPEYGNRNKSRNGTPPRVPTGRSPPVEYETNRFRRGTAPAWFRAGELRGGGEDPQMTEPVKVL